jgi:hypothetical protein
MPLLHAAIGLEEALPMVDRFILAHPDAVRRPGMFLQPTGSHAVDQAKVQRFGELALVSLHLVFRDPQHL